MMPTTIRSIQKSNAFDWGNPQHHRDLSVKSSRMVDEMQLKKLNLNTIDALENTSSFRGSSIPRSTIKGGKLSEIKSGIDSLIIKQRI